MSMTESIARSINEGADESRLFLSTDHWLRLARTGDRVEAAYSAELVAVAPPRGDAYDPPPRLPALAPGQRLTFEQRLAQGQLHCFLHGWCSSPDETGAVAAARRQWQNLAPMLEAAAGYRFAPCPQPVSVPAPGWQRTLRPRALRIAPARPIGFKTTSSPAAVWLSLPRVLPQPSCNILAKLAGLLPNEVSLCFELHAFDLNDTQRQALAALSQGFTATEPSIDGADLVIEDPESRLALQHSLEQWRSSAGGIKIRCSIFANNPLPDTLLNHLGTTILGDPAMHWDDPRSAGIGLDLTTALPCDARWPLPLPDASVLAACGVPNRFPPPLGRLPHTGARLGYSAQRAVRFAAEDRTRHCYILGATGTGKSTLLYNLMRQDIEQGAGICLLDPHGDLAAQVLAAVPRRRLSDVIRIDPSDGERAVGLNVLACSGPHPQRTITFLANEMIDIFDRLYDLRRTGGPMFELYMRNALQLLMDNEVEGISLMDIPRLFEDERYRNYLLRHCRSPYVTSFWRRQAARVSGEISLENIAPYITCKLNRFTHNALLRPIIAQPQSTVDWRECMDRGRIVLVSLPKGLLGDLDARLLGMLVVGQLLNTALARTDRPPDERRPFHLYIDEAHNFTTATVAQLLAEARKFGLHLTLANQHLAQVDDTVEAILGNVGSLLLFRLGVRDSGPLSAYLGGTLSARELENLPDHHAAARLLVHGRPVQPFVFRTESALLPQRTTQAQRERQRRLAARYNDYTRPVAEVEAELAARWQG